MNNYKLNIPYPEIHIEKPDIHTARLIIPLYSGPYGELSGISTYLYQSLITQQKDKYLSEILECLAVTEMKHFRMLGRIIGLCGIKPRLTYINEKGQNQYWSGRYAECEETTERFLQTNLNEERQGLSYYKKTYEKISDRKIQRILDRIMTDEEHHIKIFEDLLK